MTTGVLERETRGMTLVVEPTKDIGDAWDALSVAYSLVNYTEKILSTYSKISFEMRKTLFSPASNGISEVLSPTIYV